MPEVTGLRPGDPQRIAQYAVLGRLGSGGQGVVFLAEAPDGRRVAVKQLLVAQDEQAQRQLVKEVSAARRVEPFCTAQVLDADLTGPSPYVVSEFIDGPSLHQRVRQDGVLAGSALRWMAIGTATALAAIHQAGVVHRDFKPGNVMLAADGPRVIDFGIARDLSTETTVTSRVFGTPAYMAPEQVRNERVGPWTDVFAWASVIAFAATGRAPFDAEHMMAVVYRITSDEPDLTGVPAEITGVLRRCLAKDPADRPTMQQVLVLLLGRPEPAGAPADADQLLGEATSLVHQAVGAGAPTVVRSEAATRPEPGPARSSAGVGEAGLPTMFRATPPGSPTTEAPTLLRAQPPRTGRGRLTWGLLIGAGVLVLALAGYLVVHGRSGDDPDATASGSRPATTAPGLPAASATTTQLPTPSTATSPAGTVAPSSPAGGTSTDVPAAFDGDWAGSAALVSEPSVGWNVEIGLEEGDDGGRLDLPSLGCSGRLSVTRATARRLTMHAVIDRDDNGACADDGTVALTLTGEDAATYSWKDDGTGSDDAAGTVARQ